MNPLDFDWPSLYLGFPEEICEAGCVEEIE